MSDARAARPSRLFARMLRVIDAQSTAGRLVLFLAVLLGVGGAVTWVAITANPTDAPEARTVLLLLNLNLVLLVLLVVLVGGRAWALWRARRGGEGGPLETRMVAMFGLVAVTPAVLVSIFSLVFFNYGLDTWFSDRVQRALTNSRNVAQAYLEEHKTNIRADALAMAADLGTEMPLLVEGEARLARLLDAQAALRTLTEAVVFTSDGREIGRAHV